MNNQEKLTNLIPSNYECLKKLGEGGNGIVYHLKEKSTNKEYAIKILKNKREKAKEKERFLIEIEFLKKHKHKNILSLLEYDKKELYHITRFYPQTYRLKIQEESNWEVLFKYIFQIVDGIKYLHDHDYIHRDIKPENILVDGYELVIADFGIVKETDSTLTKKNDILANRFYAAPEQLKKNNALSMSTSVDIYALGMVINESFTKEVPRGNRFKKIEEDYPFLQNVDKLISLMMNMTPEERPTIDQVKYTLLYIFESTKREISEICFDKEPEQEVLQSLFFANNYLQEDKILKEQKIHNTSNNNIRYSLDQTHVNSIILMRILEICKAKFEYEGVNTLKHRYTPLNLENNNEHKYLHEKFVNKFLKYAISEAHIEIFNLALKYFDSCEDYHCRELIDENNANYIYTEIDEIEKYTKDVDIYTIINYLKSIPQTFDEKIWDMVTVSSDLSLNNHNSIQNKQESLRINNQFDKKLENFQKLLLETLNIEFTVIPSSIMSDSIDYKLYLKPENYKKLTSKLEYADDRSVLWGDIQHIIEKIEHFSTGAFLNISDFDMGRIKKFLKSIH